MELPCLKPVFRGAGSPCHIAELGLDSLGQLVTVILIQRRRPQATAVTILSFGVQNALEVQNVVSARSVLHHLPSEVAGIEPTCIFYDIVSKQL